MLKKIKIQVEGIHCKSCKTLIETEVDVLVGVKDIQVDHQTGKCQIEFDDKKISQKKIFARIEKLGYKVGKEKFETKEKKAFFKKLIIVSILFVVFIIGYYVIRQFGLLEILSKLNEEHISYWLILLIGILVSFHCVGMCGGLVVAYTVKNQANKNKKKIKASWAHAQYNLGRMVTYTTIGGILGGFGSFFGISPSFTGTVTLVAGGFMVLMGLSLLTRFKWIERVKLRTPMFIARFLYGQRHTRKPKGPFIIGLLNGFMPCGPLQAMQLYALASGSIVRGALSMAIYSAGTVPLMFGFGSFVSLISHKRIKQIMKFSGAIVIVLGLFMFNRGLINFGYDFKSLTSSQQTSQTKDLGIDDAGEYQIINMDLTYKGYEPNVLFAKNDTPVRWVINVKEMTGCTNEILLPDYGIKRKLKQGENIIEFIPDKLGDIKFSCWMQMVWGKFVITEEGEQPASQDAQKEALTLPSGTCGGGGSCGGSCGTPSCGCGSTQ
jgi:uncharacterized protein